MYVKDYLLHESFFSLSQQRSRNEEHSVVCTSPNVTRDVKTKKFPS